MLNQDKPIKSFWKLFQFTLIKLEESTRSEAAKEALEEVIIIIFGDQGEKRGRSVLPRCTRKQMKGQI